MRITGLGLLAYFIGHIYETSHILDGKAVWDASLEMTQTTEGHIFLAIAIGMCVYHTGNGIRRSEEHTSELQSLVNLVCRLLLDKKQYFYHFPSNISC